MSSLTKDFFFVRCEEVPWSTRIEFNNKILPGCYHNNKLLATEIPTFKFRIPNFIKKQYKNLELLR